MGKWEEDEVLIAFCIIDDVLKALGWKGDPQQEMSDSEVLTVAWMAHRYFGANYAATLKCLRAVKQNLFSHLLSPSRFNRRLHRLRDFLQWLVYIPGIHPRNYQA